MKFVGKKGSIGYVGRTVLFQAARPVSAATFVPTYLLPFHSSFG